MKKNVEIEQKGSKDLSPTIFWSEKEIWVSEGKGGMRAREVDGYNIY